jgi:Flp pilus assembly protein TadG
MRPQSSLLKDDRGAVAPITIVMLVAFFALLAIVTDLGHLMLVRSQLQNAADAGALAGAGALSPYTSSGPNWAAGQKAAIATVQANKADTYWLSTATVQTGYWDTTWTPATAPASLLSTGIVPGPTNVPAVKVSIQKIGGSNNGPVALTFGQIFGISTVKVAAHATAMLSPPSGPFAYAMFSNQNLSITGLDYISGSIHSNNELSIIGAEIITGAAEGFTEVNLDGLGILGSVATGPNGTINEGGFFIGPKSYNAQDITPMPDFSSQIASTAATTITPPSGTYTQSNDLNLSGNIYVNGNVILNGVTHDTGAILASGNITVNGAADISGSGQAFLYSANGNITIDGADIIGFGNGSSSAILYAPKGTISITGLDAINGAIIANQVTFPLSLFYLHGGFPIVSLGVGVPQLVQ